MPMHTILRLAQEPSIVGLNTLKVLLQGRGSSSKTPNANNLRATNLHQKRQIHQARL